MSPRLRCGWLAFLLGCSAAAPPPEPAPLAPSVPSCEKALEHTPGVERGVGSRYLTVLNASSSAIVASITPSKVACDPMKIDPLQTGRFNVDPGTLKLHYTVEATCKTYTREVVVAADEPGRHVTIKLVGIDLEDPDGTCVSAQ